MKKITVFCLTLLFIANIYGQSPDTTFIHKKSEFGLHAGFTTGAGFSYRYWPTKIGFQLTVLPIKMQDLTYFNFGVTGLYTVYDSKAIRVFGYFGNNVTYEKSYHDDYNSTTDANGNYQFLNTRDKYERFKYNFGFGPGFGFGSIVRFNIMAGFGFYDVLEKFYILPTGEIGLYYRY